MKALLRRALFRLRLAIEHLGYRFHVPFECRPRYPTHGRDSPYASLRFSVGDREALLCYGRPSAAGRAVFGGLVPWGQLWRTGANEPTTLHLPFRARIAGISVPKGRYALYTIPGDPWTLVVNRSTRQSGRTREERGKKGNVFPSAYTAEVASAEVGRAPLVSRTAPHVEQLTFRAATGDERTTELVLAWERTEVVIPITA